MKAAFLLGFIILSTPVLAQQITCGYACEPYPSIPPATANLYETQPLYSPPRYQEPIRLYRPGEQQAIRNWDLNRQRAAEWQQLQQGIPSYQQTPWPKD